MEMKEILERMHGQKLYFCNDETLMKEQAACLEILYDFNQTRPGEGEKRTARGFLQVWRRGGITGAAEPLPTRWEPTALWPLVPPPAFEVSGKRCSLWSPILCEIHPCFPIST